MSTIRITSVVPSIEAATQIAAAGFVQPLTPALRGDVERHLKKGCLVQSFCEGEAVVGFAIYQLFVLPAGERLLYLAGIILDPKVQGQGLAARSIRAAADELGATHLGLRTQSPRMWLVGARLAEGDWGPHPDRAMSPEILALGHALAEAINCNGAFPHIRGIYGGPLYGEKPLYEKSPHLQCWWDDQCSFHAGDAVLCVGTLPTL